MMKTKLDNYVTNRTNAIYIKKNDTKLLRLVEPGVVYDKNKIG